MFKWSIKSDITAQNAIFLEDNTGEQGRPFKARFLQAGLVKYDFGVCLLQKETIDKFVDTFVECPVIIDHKDNISPEDKKGAINKIWFSAEDGWFWCSGYIKDDNAINLIENGYNVSCQYRITDYEINSGGKLHNGNPYDKEILNGVFEHLAIVKTPRYEGAFIAVNAIMADDAVCQNGDSFNEEDHPRDDEGKFTDGADSGVNPNYESELNEFLEKAKANPTDRTKINVGEVSNKLIQDAQKNGFDLSNYNHNLDVSGTRHAFKHHGNEKAEEKRGQIAITDDDFKQIPNIIYNYDDIDFGETDDKGTPLIKYKKSLDNGTTYYVEEIRNKQKTLTIKSMYKTKKASNSGLFADFNLQRSEYTSNIIITDINTDFNPTAQNSIEKYNKVFEWIRNYKTGGTMDNETKTLFSSLIQALTAKNEADEKKEEDKKDDETASNEKVDKRDIIRQIMAIAGKHEDNEDVRTIAKLAEKLAYDDSEAGTADNGKAKNEDDVDEKKDEKKEDEAKNKCKNEGEKKLCDDLKDKVDEVTAKNSIDQAVNKLYEAIVVDREPDYISEKKGLELGKQIYG